MKQRVLICLTGLTRTFQKTASLLFERIIEPNKEYYDFDIIINTDSKGKGITYGRPDTMHTGFSCLQPKPADLVELLATTYNISNSAVTIYDFNESYPVMSGFLVFKRIALCLLAAKGNVYDMYITMRLDGILTRAINLREYANNLVICTGDGTRPSYFHERDVIDTPIIGSHDAFMKLIYSFIICGKATLSVFPESHNFMPPTDFMNQDLKNRYMYEWINYSGDLEAFSKQLGLKHCNMPWMAYIIINNSVQNVDVMGVYGDNAGNYFRNNLLRTLAIINETHPVLLGEHIDLHTINIRS